MSYFNRKRKLPASRLIRDVLWHKELYAVPELYSIFQRGPIDILWNFERKQNSTEMQGLRYWTLIQGKTNLNLT